MGPKPEPLGTQQVGISDPAHGARVPRCKVCGLPDSEANRVLDGIWRSGGTVRRLRMCERCIGPDDPPTADPMQLPETG